MGKLVNHPASPGPAAILKLLEQVCDPEVPVLSVIDLGVVRKVEETPDGITVTITPTYSGCPAMDMIAGEIRSVLERNGFTNVTIKTVLSPAWTTEWLSDAAKEKLRAYGIAPPEHSTADKNALLGKERSVKCPRCGSTHTEMISNFGSTACKALWKCMDCKEPFDYFKCI